MGVVSKAFFKSTFPVLIDTKKVDLKKAFDTPYSPSNLEHHWFLCHAKIRNFTWRVTLNMFLANMFLLTPPPYFGPGGRGGSWSGDRSKLYSMDTNLTFVTVLSSWECASVDSQYFSNTRKLTFICRKEKSTNYFLLSYKYPKLVLYIIFYGEI